MKRILLATALAGMASMASAQDVVRIASEGAYEPYNYIDQTTGKLVGFEIELGNELCKRAELNCEWVQNEWDSIIPNLQSGNYDAIMAGMSITEDRQKVINFSEAYTPTPLSAYVALTADANIGEGAVVAAQTGTIQAGHVAETGATLVEFATPDESVAAVKNGEADAVLADKDYLVPIAKDSNGELTLLDKDVQIGGGIGVGLRKSDEALKAKFDAAVESAKADGTINALLVKYFGADTQVF